MDVILPVSTLFYRATAAPRPWTDVLTGRGAFYGHAHGARYNASRQATIYTSTDPIVASPRPRSTRPCSGTLALVRPSCEASISCRPRLFPRCGCGPFG
jgi:RES domain-containing protein